MIVASLFACFVGLAVVPNATGASYTLFVSAAALILAAFVVSRIPFTLKSENRRELKRFAGKFVMLSTKDSCFVGQLLDIKEKIVSIVELKSEDTITLIPLDEVLSVYYVGSVRRQ